MAGLFTELLLSLVRALIADWLKHAAVSICGWLDTKITGRYAKLIIGGLLGLAAYFILPVIMGLLS
jgi:hypothetical protein